MSENYLLRIITGNYQWELSSENYESSYYITLHGKVEIYRDTGVSNKHKFGKIIFFVKKFIFAATGLWQKMVKKGLVAF